MSGARALLLFALLGATACKQLGPMQDLTDPRLFPIGLRTVVSGLEAPTYLTAPPGDPRLYVVEQAGRVLIVDDGEPLPTPFLDITADVSFRGEQGLLGMAFAPDYGVSGRFVVHYSGLEGETRVESFQVPDGADEADLSTRELILEVPQPFSNHNGGQVEFGPDGMLYVALGDGGGAGDPLGHGQDFTTLLGSILRLDVTGAGGYTIPADNPFVGHADARPEILHYGLRNPWRFSFATEPALLMIGDVGQNDWEEVNSVSVSERGLNFGWNVMEAQACFGAAQCNAEGLRLPVAAYPSAEGCSVIGGYMYEGTEIPLLLGRYVYSDFCEGWIRTFRIRDNGLAHDPVQLLINRPGSITSLGRDAAGELYLLTADGTVFKLVDLQG